MSRALLVLLLLALAGGGGYYWHLRSDAGGQAASGAAGGRGGPGGPGAAGGAGGRDRPAPIVVEKAVTRDFPVRLSAIGTVVPRTVVTVRSRVDGTLNRIAFEEGQQVRAGDLLAEIDPRPFEVALVQMQGQMARDQALLANARADWSRYEGLAKLDAIPTQQLDTQRALVRQYEAAVKIDQGQVDSARLQLSFTRITAPSDGRTGLRQVDPGNLVRSSDANGIVVITQVQPVTVVFPIPEAELGKLLERLGLQTPRERARGRGGRERPAAGSSPAQAAAGAQPVAGDDSGGRPGKRGQGGRGKDRAQGSGLAVEAWDRDGKVLLATGELLTVDNQIDVSTGTVKVKAIFPNRDGALFPNQFVNVRLIVSHLKDATMIPSAALQRGARGSFVWLLGEDQTVAMRQVSAGTADGDQLPILDGLQAGDQVAVDGFDRLREGARVEVVSQESRAVKTGPGQRGARLGGQSGGGQSGAVPPAAAGSGVETAVAPAAQSSAAPPAPVPANAPAMAPVRPQS